MGASAQGGMKPQQPQQPQQRPMGSQQGKGPGLPMPQQPQMGGNRPYQPVGANNGPFHQNPVAPVQQPMQPMPQQPGQQGLGQGKGPGQGLTPDQMKYLQPMMQGQPQPQVMQIPPGGGYPMPPQKPFVGQGNDMPMQPNYRGPDSFGNMPPNQGKGPSPTGTEQTLTPQQRGAFPGMPMNSAQPMPQNAVPGFGQQLAPGQVAPTQAEIDRLRPMLSTPMAPQGFGQQPGQVRQSNVPFYENPNPGTYGAVNNNGVTAQTGMVPNQGKGPM